MTQPKATLIKYSIEKAENALKNCEMNIQNDFLTEAQNRAYYSVFYIVLALAYMDEFTAGKHHKLMGWFNKTYIYEQKIFGKSFGKIYSRLILNREKFDYNVLEFPEKEQTAKDFEDAKFFVVEVKKFILSNIENLSDD